jgi:hypothetical protein
MPTRLIHNQSLIEKLPECCPVSEGRQRLEQFRSKIAYKGFLIRYLSKQPKRALRARYERCTSGVRLVNHNVVKK